MPRAAVKTQETTTTATSRWRSRITGHAEVAPDQLLANPFNFRVHSQAQQAAMQGALDEIGWIDEVIVNETTGHMVNGHMRVLLALRQGEPTVPVKYVALAPDEEVTALLTFDQIAAQASADRQILAAAMQDVSVQDAALRDFLGQIAMQEKLLQAALPPMDYTPSPLAAPGALPGGVPVTGALPTPPSHVRMVQLFCNTETHPELLQLSEALARHFTTDNLTDTVLETLRYAVHTLGLDAPAP